MHNDRTTLFQKKKSVAALARQYAVGKSFSAESLRKGYYRYLKTKNRNKNHGNQKFENKFESQLLWLLQALSFLGDPIQRWEAIVAAKNQLGNHQWNGDGWFNRFKKRNSNILDLKIATPMSYLRCKLRHRVKAKEFFEIYRELRTRRTKKPTVLINVDEIRYSTYNDKSKQKYLVSRNIKMPKKLKPTVTDCVAAVVFIESGGDVLLTVHIAKDKEVAKKEKITKKEKKMIPVKIEKNSEKKITRSNRIKNRMIIKSSSAWMSREQWRAIVAEFVKIYKQRFFGKFGLIVMDRLHSHFDESAVKEIIGAQMEIIYLPPHLSHIVQPLDQEPFGNAKRVFHQNCNIWRSKMWNSTRGHLYGRLQEIVAQSEDEGFTKKILKAGFRSSGLEPMNWGLVKKKLNGFIDEKFLKTEPDAIKQRSELKSLTPFVDRYFELKDSLNSKKKRRGKFDNIWLGSEVLDIYESLKKKKKTTTKQTTTTNKES